MTFVYETFVRQYAKLCNLTEAEGISAPAPDFLFELEYSDPMNARFERTREGRDVFYAFHGSRLENFHSIIHNGLHCHLNKVSATGIFKTTFYAPRQRTSYGICVCRTPFLERGPTSPVTSAWLFSTVLIAAAGEKASSARCSAAWPCVKSSTIRMLSAR